MVLINTLSSTRQPIFLLVNFDILVYIYSVKSATIVSCFITCSNCAGIFGLKVCLHYISALLIQGHTLLVKGPTILQSTPQLITLPGQWSLITISQYNHSFHPMFPTDHCRLVSIFRRKVRWRSEHVYTRITGTCRLT